MKRWSFLLSVFVFGIVWSAYSFFRSPTMALSSAPMLLEESLSGIQAIRFDKQGNVRQVLNVAKWQHLKNETLSTMLYPHLTLHDRDGRVCHISADRGESFQASLKNSIEKLHLTENVVIRHLSTASESSWELKTDNVLYFPHSSIALTDDPVTLLGPAAVVHAHGMRAYLDQRRVEFLHEVQSQYETLL